MRITRRAAVSGIAVGTAGTLVRAASAAPLDPGLCGARSVDGFQPFCFTDSAKRTHQVYVSQGKAGGPPVILLHELPGLVDADLCAATRLAEAGFTVVAPLFFGEPGGEGRGIRPAFSHCDDDEFACNSGRATSPIVKWLRELTVEAYARWRHGKGVGVVGMCLTGAFPLAMLREQVVVAPVLCQPTLPFSPWNPFVRFGWFTDTKALAVSDDDLRYARDERDVPLLGIRYEDDWRCPKERFERLQHEFGSRFDSLVLKGSHHSTLGGDFCDVAFQKVVTFLKRQLLSPAAGGSERPPASGAVPTCPSKESPCGAVSHHPSME